MFKILSDEDLRHARWSCDFNRGDSTTRYKVIAQAQMRADARELIARLVQFASNGDYAEMLLPLTKEEYEALEKMAQVAG
ncbi:MAG: hypothetical protein M0Q12_14510 [Synergistaceae bacterium]|jgi:hypothetical protein|nr:hypothetical protein [Synergistaceae bacterium]